MEVNEEPYTEDAIRRILSSPLPKLTKGPDFYQPKTQDYFAFENGEWKTSSGTSGSSSSHSHLRILSFNIDVLIPYGKQRMEAALNYLSGLISNSQYPIVIFFQEMAPSDMKQIREAQWIRERFYLTDIDHRRWLTPIYGTTTLIDRRLSIKEVFRVPWVSNFDRDGLFVDLVGTGLIRLCNAHLESLVADPPVRPQQLAAARPYLQDSKVKAALLAGDCNAIQPFDRSLHSENGLKDAYLELGGLEDSDDGYTWGFQCKKWMQEKFGPSRMDKLLYCGDFEAKSLERIGIGLRVEDDSVRDEMIEKLDGDWVSDHYGLDVVLELTNGVRMQREPNRREAGRVAL